MRIIAGSARGRPIETPEGRNTRPTLARVKESVFGMLQFEIPDSRVLDLFSGSGSLGLEAASRGAEFVVCNDHARACAACIQRNADRLQLSERVMVLQMDYAACIERLHAAGERFHIVFLDAPYADETAEKAATLLFEKNMILGDGRIVIEHAPDKPPVVSQALAQPVLCRRYGDCAVTIWKGTQQV